MDAADRLVIAVITDIVIGDPRFFFHPVRLIGSYISFLEKLSRAFFSRFLLLAGAFTCFSSIAISYFVVLTSISLALSCGEFYAEIVEIIWLWLGVSAGDLDKSVRKVLHSMRGGKLDQARRNLSQIVGRDTEVLDESEIARAAVETTAESFVDGIVSPVFFYIIGGAPLLWAFKALSTCDSMIGHRDDKYILFGRASARLDDFANFAPARLSFAFILIGTFILSLRSKHFHPLFCLKAFCSDRRKHASPNSGVPESAFAGALNIRLGGVNYYDGERYESPLIFPSGTLSEAEDIESALCLMWTSFTIFIIFSYCFLICFGVLFPIIS